MVVATIIGYQFRDMNLLEEALESPDSGDVCGEDPQTFSRWNAGLAKVGDEVMRLVLREQCCLFKIPEGKCFSISIRVCGQGRGRGTKAYKLNRRRKKPSKILSIT
jgi:hypothetical protein